MAGTDSVVAIFSSKDGALSCRDQLAAVGINCQQIFCSGPRSDVEPYVVSMSGSIEGFFEAISGWGLRPNQAGYYRRALRDGKFLVLICAEPADVNATLRILQQTPALEVNLHVTASESQCALPSRS